MKAVWFLVAALAWGLALVLVAADGFGWVLAFSGRGGPDSMPVGAPLWWLVGGAVLALGLIALATVATRRLPAPFWKVTPLAGALALGFGYLALVARHQHAQVNRVLTGRPEEYLVPHGAKRFAIVRGDRLEFHDAEDEVSVELCREVRGVGLSHYSFQASGDHPLYLGVLLSRCGTRQATRYDCNYSDVK